MYDNCYIYILLEGHVTVCGSSSSTSSCQLPYIQAHNYWQGGKDPGTVLLVTVMTTAHVFVNSKQCVQLYSNRNLR